MRNQSIDIAKALAICGIVLGHVMRGLSAAAIADPLQGWYEEVDTGLYLVHLSVFFFVSALFLRRGVDREGSSTYLKRRIALLAWLFLAWTLIQGTIQLLSARLVNTPIEPISLVVGLVKPLGQLWFLPTLAIFTLIVVGIAPWKSRGRYLALLVAACAISLARWGVGGEWFFARDLAMFAFFGAGAIVRADRFGRWIASRVSTVIGFLGLLVYTIICWTSDPTPPPEHFAFSRVDATSVTLGVFAATGGLLGVLMISKSLTYVPVVREALAFVGKRSLHIFLAHIVFAAATRIGLMRMGVDDLVIHLIAGTTAGVALSLLLAVAAERLPPAVPFLAAGLVAATHPHVRSRVLSCIR
ncbi:MAG: acyltransferase [Marmoricola sp.]